MRRPLITFEVARPRRYEVLPDADEGQRHPGTIVVALGVRWYRDLDV